MMLKSIKNYRGNFDRFGLHPLLRIDFDYANVTVSICGLDRFDICIENDMPSFQKHNSVAQGYWQGVSEYKSMKRAQINLGGVLTSTYKAMHILANSLTQDVPLSCIVSMNYIQYVKGLFFCSKLNYASGENDGVVFSCQLTSHGEIFIEHEGIEEA